MTKETTELDGLLGTRTGHLSGRLEASYPTRGIGFRIKVLRRVRSLDDRWPIDDDGKWTARAMAEANDVDYRARVNERREKYLLTEALRAQCGREHSGHVYGPTTQPRRDSGYRYQMCEVCGHTDESLSSDD